MNIAVMFDLLSYKSSAYEYFDTSLQQIDTTD